MLLALRGPAQNVPVPPEAVSRSVELKRSVMGSLGRHLEEVRVQAESTLCAESPDPALVVKRLAAGYKTTVEAAALYSPAGDVRARLRFQGVEPWSRQGFFSEPGRAWLKGRAIVVALSSNATGRAGTADVRMPLQCEEEGTFRTRAWAVVRLDLCQLMDRVVTEVPLADGESVWLADQDGRALFHRGPVGSEEVRLAALIRLDGPKGKALLERMRSDRDGKLMCDGFDPGRFVFRRVMSEWTSMRLGDAPVLVVRETPGEVFTPPVSSRTGVWRDGKGARLALLVDGSSCSLHLRRAGGGAAGVASGRLLDATLSARSDDKALSYQGEFSAEGKLVVTVYADHEIRGVTREVFVFRKESAPSGGGDGGATPPRLRY